VTPLGGITRALSVENRKEEIAMLGNFICGTRTLDGTLRPRDFGEGTKP
jgi:hypothetical protein